MERERDRKREGEVSVDEKECGRERRDGREGGETF